MKLCFRSTRIHQDVKKAVYKGLVRPVLEYGSLVRDLQGEVLQEELESVQKGSQIRNRK